MKKKLTLIISMLLAFVVNHANAVDFEVDGIRYTTITVHDTPTCEVARGDYSGDIVVPSKVTYSGKTFTVTRIGYQSFSYCRKLQKVVLPNTLKEIGDCAFQESSLTEITIPEGVQTIGRNVFEKCNNLVSIVLPNSVTEMGGDAFAECKNLQSVKLPNKLKEIEYRAFYKCPKLTTVTIPQSVETIDLDVFNGDTGLTYIILPANIEYLGLSAFYGCVNLKEIIVLSKKPINIYDTTLRGVNVETCVVRVPSELVDKYKHIDPWQDFWNIEGNAVEAAKAKSAAPKNASNR